MKQIVLFNGTKEPDGKSSYGGRYVARTLTSTGYSAECRYSTNPDEYVVGWGFEHPRAVLNGDPRRGKFQELTILHRAGIPVPPHSRQWRDHWLGRAEHHTGGQDLLNPPDTPGYWVKFLDTVLEYRVHVFWYPDKLPRTKLAVRWMRGDEAHPWMRNTWEHGWTDLYDQGSITQLTIRFGVDITQITAQATKAVQAMGYTFSAVDIAWTKEATPVVWEVNSQPYIPGPETARFYANGILAWYKETQ